MPRRTTYPTSAKTRPAYVPCLEALEPRDLPSSDLLLNAVLAFAERHLRHQVGNSQCAVLAMEALRRAGAKTNLGPSGPWANYVWGNLVLEEVGGAGGGQVAGGSFGGVQPGDVIQFSNADFVLNTPTYCSWQSYPHHTALIEACLGNGWFSILQQNVNGNMTVQRGVIDFSQLTTGTVWVYQPVPRGQPLPAI
jgi:hypothetical protein